MSRARPSFGYNISELARKQAELGLTDKELARRAAVHPSTVKNVLTGQTCRAPTVKRIAEALGLKLADLVLGNNDTPPSSPSDDGPGSARRSGPRGKNSKPLRLHHSTASMAKAQAEEKVA